MENGRYGAALALPEGESILAAILQLGPFLKREDLPEQPPPRAEANGLATALMTLQIGLRFDPIHFGEAIDTLTHDQAPFSSKQAQHSCADKIRSLKRHLFQKPGTTPPRWETEGGVALATPGEKSWGESCLVPLRIIGGFAPPLAERVAHNVCNPPPQAIERRAISNHESAGFEPAANRRDQELVVERRDRLIDCLVFPPPARPPLARLSRVSLMASLRPANSDAFNPHNPPPPLDSSIRAADGPLWGPFGVWVPTAPLFHLISTLVYISDLIEITMGMVSIVILRCRVGALKVVLVMGCGG
jgi:hypothetical protein